MNIGDLVEYNKNDSYNTNTYGIIICKEKKIFGGNAREFLPKIASFVVDESIELWSYVNLDPSRKRDLEKLLPSRDACEAYVYATLYSCMGAYDKYSTEQREQKSKRPRTE